MKNEVTRSSTSIIRLPQLGSDNFSNNCTDLIQFCYHDNFLLMKLFREEKKF